jgi:hypothetical protein
MGRALNHDRGPELASPSCLPCDQAASALAAPMTTIDQLTGTLVLLRRCPALAERARFDFPRPPPNYPHELAHP